MAYGYINQQATPYSFLKSQLWHAGLLPGPDHFDVLNKHLRQGVVRPGELVIVPEMSSAYCSIEEAWLMRHAEEISRQLDQNVPLDRAGNTNYDLAQSILGYGSIGIGSATSAWSRHLQAVAQTLMEIEQLHRQLKDGGLDKESFIRQRQRMFGVLDMQLQGAARFGSGLRGNQPLKGALGISTKKLSTSRRNCGVCAAGSNDYADVEMVKARNISGVGVGCGRGGFGNEGGVCGGKGGAVSTGEVCGDGEVAGWSIWGRCFGQAWRNYCSQCLPDCIGCFTERQR